MTLHICISLSICTHTLFKVKVETITMVQVQLDENRVWIDGCFDFTHHGHGGAILQARQTIKGEGTLLCGVHNDQDIAFNKGSVPVMTSKERYEHTRANRWCGEVIEDAPYATQPDWLDRYGCLYVVHGDDITLDANGEDCYKVMKDMGRFRVVKRTAGVSTTEIIHRILTKTPQKLTPCELPTLKELEMYSSGSDGYSRHCYVFKDDFEHVLVEGDYKFIANDCRFVIGEFDLFHMGQIEQLWKVKHVLQPTDKPLIAIITTRKSCIMSLKERILSVLCCKYVDGVVIDTTDKNLELPVNGTSVYELDDKELTKGGKFSEYLTEEVIIKRIENDRDNYIKRNEKKGMSI